jgi:AraC-like DNA-binding protein
MRLRDHNFRDHNFARLCRAREMLQEVQEDAPSVEHVARAVEISPFHFIRQFEALLHRGAGLSEKNDCRSSSRRSSSRPGSAHTFRSSVGGVVAADMFCLLRLDLEISVQAKALLLALKPLQVVSDRDRWHRYLLAAAARGNV